MQHAATSPEELPRPEDLAEMTGLEVMHAMLDGRLPGAPIAATLGYRLESVADGRAVFRGAPGFAHANPMGTTHGGWYGTLLDSAMACAVMTRVPRGASYTTLEYKVNIVRPLPAGTEIRCEGIAGHVGRRTGVATGEIRGVGDDRLYAIGSTTCIVLGA